MSGVFINVSGVFSVPGVFRLECGVFKVSGVFRCLEFLGVWSF